MWEMRIGLYESDVLDSCMLTLDFLMSLGDKRLLLLKWRNQWTKAGFGFRPCCPCCCICDKLIIVLNLVSQQLDNFACSGSSFVNGTMLGTETNVMVEGGLSLPLHHNLDTSLRSTFSTVTEISQILLLTNQNVLR